MDIYIGDVPNNTTAPMFPSYISPVSTVPATLTEQDKEALKVMIREVVAEVVNEALDERERRADEARQRQYWEI